MSERAQAAMGVIAFTLGGGLLSLLAPALAAREPELALACVVAAAMCGPLALVDLARLVLRE